MKYAIKYILSFIAWNFLMFYLMRLFINIDFSLHVYTPLGRAYHAFFTHVSGIFLSFFFSLITAEVKWCRK